MSHFTKIKTRLFDKGLIIEALEELKYTVDELATTIHGYGGQMKQAEFIVKANKSYDIGFVKEKDGSYDIVADWYGIRNIKKQDFFNNIKQKYSLGMVKREMKKKGYKMIRTENQADNSIKVTWRKW
ncbi:MAG: DUF1257 domain-containing protein [Promethearchaeota archaeon]